LCLLLSSFTPRFATGALESHRGFRNWFGVVGAPENGYHFFFSRTNRVFFAVWPPHLDKTQVWLGKNQTPFVCFLQVLGQNVFGSGFEGFLFFFPPTSRRWARGQIDGFFPHDFIAFFFPVPPGRPTPPLCGGWGGCRGPLPQGPWDTLPRLGLSQVGLCVGPVRVKGCAPQTMPWNGTRFYSSPSPPLM